MRNINLLCLLLLPCGAMAQKHWVAKNGVDHAIDAHWAEVQWNGRVAALDTNAIKAQLLESLPNLQTHGSGLRLLDQNISPKARHFHFRQTVHGRDVFRGAVKVNVTPDGRILSLFNHTFDVKDVAETTFPDHAPYQTGLLAHYGHKPNGNMQRYELSEVYFPNDEGTVEPCIRLEVLDDLGRFYEMVLNTAVRVIYQNDLIAYARMPAPIDSLITLSVFLPDPLTSSNNLYGAPFVDANDADAAPINAERVNMQTVVTFDNGMFTLANQYAKIVDASAPTVAPATSNTNSFNLNRANDGFEDVNAFYHINAFQLYMQSLGFNLVNYQINVDAHALNGSDNSNFNPGNTPPLLSFGEGGVDDAEDADVVVHEYGHAISHSAAPNTNNGTERRALDEAIGDYFACSYSRSIDPFGWDRVFSWDGHNEFWAGRSTISTDHYPEDLAFNIYTDADIWSATLMQIWGDIGREVTDAIMLQSNYSFTEGMTMSQAALLFLQADTLQFGGSHFTPIRQRMYDRGLIPWNVDVPTLAERPFQVLGSAGFANGQSAVRIRFNADQKGSYSLVDALGREIMVGPFNGRELAVDPVAAASGMLFLKLNTSQGSWTVKLVGLR